MRLISVVTPCYNEEENVEELYNQVKQIFGGLKDYSYEHIFIDNASADNTLAVLKRIASSDKNVKIIVNARNFGHIRSPYYGLLQAGGDAAISLSADLEEPPQLIRDFIKKWEEGYKIVVGIKKGSREPLPVFLVRRLYYVLINRLSETELLKDFNGFGLYDKTVIAVLRQINDPYPYFRGLICDIGFDKAQIEYIQSEREKGRTKNNFYTLYDMGMLGITSYSKIPLRLATGLGFICSLLSTLTAFIYLVYKLLFWDTFSVGIAPLVIGFFFLFSVLLFFIGILGEYIGSIHTQVLRRPLVIEKERINF